MSIKLNKIKHLIDELGIALSLTEDEELQKLINDSITRLTDQYNVALLEKYRLETIDNY